MAVIRLSYFTLVSILFSFDTVSAAKFEDDYAGFTHSSGKLIGDWYLVAMISVASSNEVIPCITDTKIKTDDHEYLSTSITGMLDGEKRYKNWLTKIEFGEMHHYDVDDNNNRTLGFSQLFDVFIEWELLVVYNITSKLPYALYSQFPKVDKIQLTNYIDTAKVKNWTMQYVNFNFCIERNRHQHIIDQGITDKFDQKWSLLCMICPKRYTAPFQNINLYLDVISDYSDTLEMKIYKKDEYDSKSSIFGKIFHSQLIIVNNTDAKPYGRNITFYNDDTHVLINNLYYKVCDTIWTLRTNNPDESLERYKKIADDKKWKMIYVK